MNASTEVYLWVVNLCALIGALTLAAGAVWVARAAWIGLVFGPRLDDHERRITRMEGDDLYGE